MQDEEKRNKRRGGKRSERDGQRERSQGTKGKRGIN